MSTTSVTVKGLNKLVNPLGEKPPIGFYALSVIDNTMFVMLTDDRKVYAVASLPCEGTLFLPIQLTTVGLPDEVEIKVDRNVNGKSSCTINDIPVRLRDYYGLRMPEWAETFVPNGTSISVKDIKKVVKIGGDTFVEALINDNVIYLNRNKQNVRILLETSAKKQVELPRQLFQLAARISETIELSDQPTVKIGKWIANALLVYAAQRSQASPESAYEDATEIIIPTKEMRNRLKMAKDAGKMKGTYLPGLQMVLTKNDAGAYYLQERTNISPFISKPLPIEVKGELAYPAYSFYVNRMSEALVKAPNTITIKLPKGNAPILIDVGTHSIVQTILTPMHNFKPYQPERVDADAEIMFDGSLKTDVQLMLSMDKPLVVRLWWDVAKSALCIGDDWVTISYPGMVIGDTALVHALNVSPTTQRIATSVKDGPNVVAIKGDTIYLNDAKIATGAYPKPPPDLQFSETMDVDGNALTRALDYLSVGRGVDMMLINGMFVNAGYGGALIADLGTTTKYSMETGVMVCGRLLLWLKHSTVGTVTLSNVQKADRRVIAEFSRFAILLVGSRLTDTPDVPEDIERAVRRTTAPAQTTLEDVDVRKLKSALKAIKSSTGTFDLHVLLDNDELVIMSGRGASEEGGALRLSAPGRSVGEGTAETVVVDCSHLLAVLPKTKTATVSLIKDGGRFAVRIESSAGISVTGTDKPSDPMRLVAGNMPKSNNVKVFLDGGNLPPYLP